MKDLEETCRARQAALEEKAERLNFASLFIDQTVNRNPEIEISTENSPERPR